MHNLTSIWNEVSGWPPDERRALAARILNSLHQESVSVPVSPERRAALQQLIGIWKMKQPPTDEQLERVV